MNLVEFFLWMGFFSSFKKFIENIFFFHRNPLNIFKNSIFKKMFTKFLKFSSTNIFSSLGPLQHWSIYFQLWYLWGDFLSSSSLTIKSIKLIEWKLIAEHFQRFNSADWNSWIQFWTHNTCHYASFYKSLIKGRTRLEFVPFKFNQSDNNSVWFVEQTTSECEKLTPCALF